MQLYLTDEHRNLTPYGLGCITKLYKNAIEQYNHALVTTALKMDPFFKRIVFKSIIESEKLITVRYDLNHKEFIVLLNHTYRKRFGLCINSYPLFHITTNTIMKNRNLIGVDFGVKFKRMKLKLGSIHTNYKTLQPKPKK